MIDDGSSDRSGLIAEEWRRRDSRIQVIHQTNQGYGCAVNAGLDIAKGEFVAIFEPDDVLDSSMYQKLYEQAKLNEADLCRCGFSVFSNNGKERIEYVWPETVKLLKDSPSGVFDPENYKYIYAVHSALWTYLYKRDLFLHIRPSKERKSYLDMPFIFDVLSSCTRMVIVKENLHHYRMEEGQGSTSMTISPRAMDMIYASELSRENIKKNNKLNQLSEVFYRHCILANYYFYNKTPLDLRDSYLRSMHDFFVEAPDVCVTGLPNDVDLWFKKVKQYIVNEKLFDDIQNIFTEGGVNIALVTNSNYWDVLRVCLSSMVKRFDAKRKYNIFIVERGVDVTRLRELKTIYALIHNIKIIFISADVFKRDLQGLFVDRHLSVDTYIRFWLPGLLTNINKLLYVDVDTIACDDLSELYDINLDESWIAGAKDQAVSVCNFGDFNKAKHKLELLGYNKFDEYVNAGVLLINMDAFRKFGVADRLIKISKANSFIFHDQDALNIVCDGHKKIFDERWNFTTHCAPELYCAEVQQRMWNIIFGGFIGIIHYPGSAKPWNSNQGMLNYIWHKEAVSVGISDATVINTLSKLSFWCRKGVVYRLIVLKYKMMAKISLGRRKIHYVNKLRKIIIK